MMTTALLLVLASGGVQETGAQAPQAQPQTTRVARERRVCRVQERLGTILPRRVCRTAAEWQQIDLAQQEITERDRTHMRNNARNSLHDSAPQ
jgi:hypothetical protein